MSKATNELIEHLRDIGPVAWAESPYGWIGEDNKPIVLTNWQRAVLTFWWTYRLVVSILAISAPKKGGKTFTNSIALCFRWLTMPGLHFACGNDLDQSQARQFSEIAAMVKRNPYLRQNVKVSKTELIFTPTDSRLVALAVDATGNAGSNHLTSSHTEAWGVISTRAVEAWEQLTNPPGTFYGMPTLRIVDSYAGVEGDSQVWHSLVDLGLMGERVTDDWPIFLDHERGIMLFHAEGEEGQMLVFRGTQEEADKYYREQRATLRPMTFERLHLNRRTTGLEMFVTREQVNACVVPGLLPLQASELTDWQSGVVIMRLDDYAPIQGSTSNGGPKLSPVIVGLDLATRQDHAAVAGICWNYDINKARLAFHRTWQPSAKQDIDLGDIERYLLQVNQDFELGLVAYDPYQCSYLAQRLSAVGLPMMEYTQTLPNLKKAAEALYSLINAQRLALYPSDEVTRYLLNSRVKELSDGSGYRLVKQSAGRKIDLAVCLAWACSELLDRYAEMTPEQARDEPEHFVTIAHRQGAFRFTAILPDGGHESVYPGWQRQMTFDDAQRLEGRYPGMFQILEG